YIPELNEFSTEILNYFEIETKYEGYLAKSAREMRSVERMEEYVMPEDIDYMNMMGLRLEARQKLNKVRPLTLAQATRISGVTPADIDVLIVFLKRRKTSVK
ncbi:MAG: tRNA uridine-5-carboxymethylaminomethyl(34) synthesis enzyme MnmG, partial [Christensenellaceae bacterium]|nr:tRNA uridine-5-carboxymethylaminomethyl(34) synthesis enzyme MnmG [Christensenellaceae bacterium]